MHIRNLAHLEIIALGLGIFGALRHMEIDQLIKSGLPKEFSMQNANVIKSKLGIISFIYAILVMLCGCQPSPPIERGRIASPNGVYDAIVVEFLSNALGESGFGIVILEHDKKIPEKIYPSLVNTYLSAKNVHWLSNSNLEVGYKAGTTIYSFNNMWSTVAEPVQVTPQIELILKRQL